MFIQLHEKTIWILACVALIATGLALGGCDSDFNGNGSAQAAERRLIKTFLIDPATFELTTDDTPTIEVKDGTTEYTLTARGTVYFTTTAFDVQVITVTTGEEIIERPESGVLTLIRFR